MKRFIIFIEFSSIAALWGGSFLFMRAAGPYFGPIPLIALRVSVASLFLLPICFLQHKSKSLLSNWKKVFVLSLTNTALPFCLLAYATIHTNAGFGAILNATAPFFTGLIFFRQKRSGRGGVPFSIIKFRTMRTDAERSGAVWATENDPRVTAVGRVLRKSRIDELPQLWNIMLGDMSLVGPRAERPEFDTQLAQQIPFYRERYLIKPGLSGWAQINYPYGASVQDALQKLQYDLYYIKHRSLALDIAIVLKTISISLRRAGR
jgi:lipopolysaccharide/colanic/teichoic acid biosynthesis glycosyltransferase